MPTDEQGQLDPFNERLNRIRDALMKEGCPHAENVALLLTLWCPWQSGMIEIELGRAIPPAMVVLTDKLSTFARSLDANGRLRIDAKRN